MCIYCIIICWILPLCKILNNLFSLTIFTHAALRNIFCVFILILLFVIAFLNKSEQLILYTLCFCQMEPKLETKQESSVSFFIYWALKPFIIYSVFLTFKTPDVWLAIDRQIREAELLIVRYAFSCLKTLWTMSFTVDGMGTHMCRILVWLNWIRKRFCVNKLCPLCCIIHFAVLTRVGWWTLVIAGNMLLRLGLDNDSHRLIYCNITLLLLPTSQEYMEEIKYEK